MVDVNPVNKNTSVNVSSSGSVSQIKTTTPQNYYDGLAKQWAIGEDKIQGLDYSSKYYAEKSKESALKAQNYVDEVNIIKNETVTEITTLKNETVDSVLNTSNTTKEEILDIEEEIVKNIEEIKTDSVELINNETKKQLQNIKSTGFYMRDDKLYFINSEGEEEEFKSGGAGAVMFDTKIADHILQGEEALGWALQGTYVSGALYPDFYNKCLEEKNNATATEATLADSALTMFVNSNGHQFYNISDKSIVDGFYNTFGIADFYGVDEENERVFLPRNKYFQQLTDDVSRVNEFVEAGLPDHLHYIGKWSGEKAGGGFTDNGPQNYGLGGSISSSLASISNSIYGNSNTVQPPSSLKLLYYCVGNTVVNDAEIDAGALVAQIETKANIFLDNVLPTQEFKTQSVSWSMPSGRYIDLTLGASGSTYTAPANGWFYLNKVAGSDWYYCEFTCAVEGSYDSLPCWGSDYKTSPIKIWTPVKKGAKIKVNYNATGKTNHFKFIYAEGEV